MTHQATVFMIDRDEGARETVRQIAEQMHVESEFYFDAEQFLAAYQPNRSGCLVSEIRLLGMSGIELQEHLLREYPLLPVILVTAYAETTFTVRAMRNGAVTVLDKPISNQELWDAVRWALTQGERSRRIESKHSELRRRVSYLTEKERRVLELMAQGKANKVIARQLNVSIRTVESRRHQIFRKTKTDSVAELLRLILQTQTDEAPRPDRWEHPTSEAESLRFL